VRLALVHCLCWLILQGADAARDECTGLLMRVDVSVEDSRSTAWGVLGPWPPDACSGLQAKVEGK
jgi:hypothetical protein